VIPFKRRHHSTSVNTVELLVRRCGALSSPSCGGIVAVSRNYYRRSTIALPQLNTFEGLCIRLSTGAESFLLLSIYWPGSVRPTAEFDDELIAVLESLVLYGCPVVISGDINIHVEDSIDVEAIRFAKLLDTFDMVQYVTRPTYKRGGTLNVVVTFRDCNIANVQADLCYGVSKMLALFL
jgi:exonuclease III